MKFVRATMKFLMDLWRWFFPSASDIQKRLQKLLEKEDETKRKELEAFERMIGEARLAFNHNLVDFYVLRTKVASLRADLGSNWTEFKMRLKRFFEHDIFRPHRDFLNDFLEQHQNPSELTERLFEALDKHVKQAFEGYELRLSDLDENMDLEAALIVLRWCQYVISPIEPSLLEDCNTHLTGVLASEDYRIYRRAKDSEDPEKNLEALEAVNVEILRAVPVIFEASKQHNAADYAAGLTELVGHLTGLENQNRDLEDLQRLFQAYKEEIEKNRTKLKNLWSPTRMCAGHMMVIRVAGLSGLIPHGSKLLTVPSEKGRLILWSRMLWRMLWSRMLWRMLWSRMLWSRMILMMSSSVASCRTISKGAV